MNQEKALISGGTSGIGKSMVFALAEQGYEVHFIGSSPDKGQKMERELQRLYPESHPSFYPLDLSDFKAIERFSQKFLENHSRLNLLVHTAGVLLPERKETAGGLEQTFAVSYLASCMLSLRLIPLLKNCSKAKILNAAADPAILSKETLDFDDLQSCKNYKPFQVSTRAVLAKTIFTAQLAYQLKETTIRVHSFHPGNIRSGLFRHLSGFQKGLFSMASLFFKKNSEMGISLCFSKESEEQTGKLWARGKAYPLNYSPELRKKLWETSQEIIQSQLES